MTEAEENLINVFLEYWNNPWSDDREKNLNVAHAALLAERTPMSKEQRTLGKIQLAVDQLPDVMDVVDGLQFYQKVVTALEEYKK